MDLPQEITLIIRVYNSGASVLPICYEEKIVEVIEDGVSRPPRNPSMVKAIRWLMDESYEPVSFKWLDPPNLIRNRRYQYAKEA